jgi:hypothetical protein
VRVERIFHLIRSRLEYAKQISVPAFEIFEHIAELLFSGSAIELQYPINDMVCSGFIS